MPTSKTNASYEMFKAKIVSVCALNWGLPLHHLLALLLNEKDRDFTFDEAVKEFQKDSSYLHKLTSIKKYK